MQTSVQPRLIDDVQTAPDEQDVQKGKEECWGGAVLVFAVLVMGELLGCERIDWLDARQQEDDDDAKGSNHGRCDPLPLFGEVLQPIHSHELFGLLSGHPLARVQPKHGHATQEVADEQHIIAPHQSPHRQIAGAVVQVAMQVPEGSGPLRHCESHERRGAPQGRR